LAKVKKLGLVNAIHRILVIMKNIHEKTRLLNPKQKNILLIKGLPTPCGKSLIAVGIQGD
jgi:hypothetical protein